MPVAPELKFVGGRLALDFVNAIPPKNDLSWETLIAFLGAARIVTPERADQLVALGYSDAQAVDGLLRKAQRLGTALRNSFEALLRKQRIARDWVEAVNEVLRITEGHDELESADGREWKLEFVAREGGLEWLLAAVARSGAEIIAEGAAGQLRVCANPHCGLFFYDNSRTRRRRWCSMTLCGNRSKVAAFARRHTSARRTSA